MRRNRIIAAALFVCSVLFASFFGGVSYYLMYLTLTVPLASFIYLLIVYSRFKLNQSLERNEIRKGESVRYRFVLSNESFVAYSDLKVNLRSDLSTAEEGETSYSLLPGERIEREFDVLCRYRGEYAVGVESVTVTDFLKLFRLTHLADTSVKIKVLPRVVRLTRLTLAPNEEDVKVVPFSLSMMKEEPDIEVREYVPGDSLKTVNWKLSARQQKMMVRKYVDLPKTKVLLLLDLERVPYGKFEERIVTEDKMIESVLSILAYFYDRQIETNFIYSDTEIRRLTVRNSYEFDQAYRVCSDVLFQSRHSASSLLRETASSSEAGSICILCTSHLDQTVCETALEYLEAGNRLNIVHFGKEPAEEILKLLPEQVTLTRIPDDVEFTDVLDSYEGGVS